MTSNLWMFNDGSYKHRGVWHAIDSVVHTDIPEDVETTVMDVKKYHTRKCPLFWHRAGTLLNWRPYGETATPDDYAHCKCDIGSDDISSVKIGEYTEIHISPAYRKSRATAICGQVTMETGGLIHKWSRFGAKHKDGEVVTNRDRLDSYNLVDSVEPPPGPVCSRCVAKREKQNQ